MTDTLTHEERPSILRRIADWFSSSGGDPIIQGIRSREAWAKWQRQVRAAKAAARAKHQPIREIERRQTETLHAALAANRQQGA